MDTYFNVRFGKCIKCYKCVMLCSDTYKKSGFLGYLTINEYDGEPLYLGDNCRCHHCKAIIDGEETPYACSKICEQGAIEIERW